MSLAIRKKSKYLGANKGKNTDQAKLRETLSRLEMDIDFDPYVAAQYFYGCFVATNYVGMDHAEDLEDAFEINNKFFDNPETPAAVRAVMGINMGRYLMSLASDKKISPEDKIEYHRQAFAALKAVHTIFDERGMDVLELEHPLPVLGATTEMRTSFLAFGSSNMAINSVNRPYRYLLSALSSLAENVVKENPEEAKALRKLGMHAIEDGIAFFDAIDDEIPILNLLISKPILVSFKDDSTEEEKRYALQEARRLREKIEQNEPLAKALGPKKVAEWTTALLCGEVTLMRKLGDDTYLAETYALDSARELGKVYGGVPDYVTIDANYATAFPPSEAPNSKFDVLIAVIREGAGLPALEPEDTNPGATPGPGAQ